MVERKYLLNVMCLICAEDEYFWNLTDENYFCSLQFLCSQIISTISFLASDCDKSNSEIRNNVIWKYL